MSYDNIQVVGDGERKTRAKTINGTKTRSKKKKMGCEYLTKKRFSCGTRKRRGSPNSKNKDLAISFTHALFVYTGIRYIHTLGTLQL